MTRAPGRVELKYSLPPEVAVRVLGIARAFLAPERHAEGGRQRLTSLYLETPHLTFLRWHQAQAADRFKLRLRRYGDGSAGVVFAELKRKTNGVVHKRRARIPEESVGLVVEGARLPDSGLGPGDRGHLAEFVRRRMVFGARPQVLVTCLRESLRGDDWEPENAVTVDRELAWQHATAPDLVGAASWSPLRLPRQGSRGAVILEVKYGAQPPTWMVPIISHLAPSRVSFSKYVTAMSQLRR